MYMPLSLIQITADYPANGLPTVREAVCRQSGLPAKQSVSDSGLYKQTVSLFISEVLYHVLRHPMPDEQLWNFLSSSVDELNNSDEPQNFHLHFLIGLAQKLGYAINGEADEQSAKLVQTPHSRAERQQQLRALCEYFAEHVETWQHPKSLDVLIEVFD